MSVSMPRVKPPMQLIIGQLQSYNQISSQLPPVLLERLNGVITRRGEQMEKEIIQEVGEFMRLDLNDEDHTEDQVQVMISTFPEALSNESQHGYHIPIQTSDFIYTNGLTAVSFIPLMAEEGNNRQLFQKCQRGGLLYNDWNVIHDIASQRDYSSASGPDGFDKKCLKVFERLRKSGLMKKSDITDFKLIQKSLHPMSQRRFDFLINWDPAALQRAHSSTDSLIHTSITAIRYPEPGKGGLFEMVLKAGMKHFPKQLGFLFEKRLGKTALEVAIDKFGLEDAVAIIKRSIPPAGYHPILLHAAKHCPTLIPKLIRHYPNLSERDPHTGLYLFMTVASGDTSDLGAIYSLLGGNPESVQGVINDTMYATIDNSKEVKGRLVLSAPNRI